jgi:alkylhydroperoxidase/carboxymuconolactone decarboxylase family protein YurZ
MTDSKKQDDLLAEGLRMMDEVYGPGVGEQTKAVSDMPFPSETVRHLFGEIWNRPHLSIRDRRLLVIGATAMLGRADLMEVQVKGAILNGELDDKQLEEAALHLAFYTGWGNTTQTWRGIQAAKQSVAEERKKNGE